MQVGVALIYRSTWIVKRWIWDCVWWSSSTRTQSYYTTGKPSQRLSGPLSETRRHYLYTVQITLICIVLSLSLSLYRASIPHRVTFTVPSELQAHLEVIPKHGLVQAHSSFAAQLKFLPKPSIQVSPDCLKFCDEGTGAYNIPVEVLVAEQVSPSKITISW